MARITLMEAYNIRDHNNNVFVNNLSLSNTAVVPTYFLNGAQTTNSIQSRMDRQQLLLPETFVGDTITSITFQGVGQGEPNGSAFLAGLTLANQSVSVPNLTIILSGTNIILTWPSNSYAFTLLSTTSLVSQAGWSTNLVWKPAWSTNYLPPVIVNRQN